ncbi:shikimate dehydrogenase [Proteinivorax hydrogeniformans]|uniref:Shikimate dehydrogenase n=1 Tax=Proteinivorax hydrogeniformans TaxID=1826727 RepID=A0AAU8HTK6_9FIRM
MDNKFAFIIHPIDVADMSRKFKFLKKLPKSAVEKGIKHLPPIKVSDIEGVESRYNKLEGNFVACTLTSNQIASLPTKFVLKKIIKAGRLSEKMGAKILGLGAMTSVVGDAGITISKNLNIPVTTGNSYTVASAIEGTKKAASLMGHSLNSCEITIVGATGSIGSVTARILAREARSLNLIARNQRRLERLAKIILQETGTPIKIPTTSKEGIKKADIIISVSGSVDCVINPEDIKSGAVVCDVARPRDVSQKVQAVRNDVFVFEGGLINVPGDVDFNFNFGFPPKTAYACMAETMILALENRFESYTLGRDLSVGQVDEINKLAKKHGFTLGGFRSFEKAVDESEIEEIKRNALVNSLNLKKSIAKV